MACSQRSLATVGAWGFWLTGGGLQRPKKQALFQPANSLSVKMISLPWKLTQWEWNSRPSSPELSNPQCELQTCLRFCISIALLPCPWFPRPSEPSQLRAHHAVSQLHTAHLQYNALSSSACLLKDTQTRLRHHLPRKLSMPAHISLSPDTHLFSEFPKPQWITFFVWQQHNTPI